jgi:hypothetical protein
MDLHVKDNLNYLKTLLDAHKTQHQFLGTDFLDIPGMLIAQVPYFNLECDTGLTATVTGTGVTTQTKSALRVDSGATSGGTAGGVFTVAWWHDKDAATSRYKWGGKVQAAGASTDKWEAWYGMFSDTTTFPVVASNHVAFRLLSTGDGTNAVLQASSGNGANGTQTQLVASVGAYATYYLIAIYGATTILFYYSTDAATWTLGATHTHGVEYTPDNVSLYYGAWGRSAEAGSKLLDVFGFRVKVGV